MGQFDTNIYDRHRAQMTTVVCALAEAMNVTVTSELASDVADAALDTLTLAQLSSLEFSGTNPAMVLAGVSVRESLHTINALRVTQMIEDTLTPDSAAAVTKQLQTVEFAKITFRWPEVTALAYQAMTWNIGGAASSSIWTRQTSWLFRSQARKKARDGSRGSRQPVCRHRRHRRSAICCSVTALQPSALLLELA